MTVLTQDQLKERFKLSRERKEKEKREKQQQKQLQYKELCHKADELLKKAQEEEKIKKIEQLQALAPKKPQKPSNEATEPLKIYHSNLVERDSNDRDLFTTREQLQQWEKENYQVIDWDAWDKSVTETKHDIKEALKDYQPPVQERWSTEKKMVYIYNNKLQLIGEYKSQQQAAKAYGLNDGSIRHLLHTSKPHKKLGIMALNFKLKH